MNKLTIRIDESHTKKLLSGERVTIKVPLGATKFSIQLTVPKHADSLAKLVDVFFNGRPA